jgi:hypothetical protein
MRPENDNAKVEVSVNLSPDAFETMQRLRDQLTQSKFLDLMLRVIDSGAIKPMPAEIGNDRMH